MRSIQDVGLEILNNNPAPLYFFCGSEIGIKEQYISRIRAHYGSSVEVASLAEVFKLMRTKHLIPLTPKLYIVRYDDVFISSLSEAFAHEIKQINIVGTIVGIFEGTKADAKLAKYAKDYSVSIDAVNPKFIKNYLRNEFTQLTERQIDVAIQSSDNYSQARNICRALSVCPRKEISNLSDSEISQLFGYNNTSTEDQIKLGVAARDFSYLSNMFDTFDGDLNNVFYLIISTLIELEKCILKRNPSSPVFPYYKNWTLEDIYNMFTITYQQLKLSRSISISDVKLLLVYLFSLLTFSPIPCAEVLN